MRTVLLIALAAGGAFLAGWFTVERDGDRTRIEINKSEIRSDARQAIDRGREILDQRERERWARENGGYDANGGWPPAGPNPPGTTLPPSGGTGAGGSAWPAQPEGYTGGGYAGGNYAGGTGNVPANYVQNGGYPSPPYAGGTAGSTPAYPAAGQDRPASYPAAPYPGPSYPNNGYPAGSNSGQPYPAGSYAPTDYRSNGQPAGGPADPRWSGAATPPPWERTR